MKRDRLIYLYHKLIYFGEISFRRIFYFHKNRERFAPFTWIGMLFEFRLIEYFRVRRRLGDVIRSNESLVNSRENFLNLQFVNHTIIVLPLIACIEMPT